MASERRIELDRIRTDGWFERLGESIGSFHTLCDVLGRHFFAFALMTDVRISSLMIDRFSPDQSLVEFVVGGEGEDAEVEPERLTVAAFRDRLASSLFIGEPESTAVDELEDNAEALQQFIGPRTMLLAPLYGYQLEELIVSGDKTLLRVGRDGDSERMEVATFRQLLLQHVQQELIQSQTMGGGGGTAIDLNDVTAAEEAAEQNDWNRVAEILGGWPMPLSIYWRTPEGQMLSEAARQRIAEGLGLLGTACSELGDQFQGEEVLRLAIQYAQSGSAAGPIFERLGRMFIDAERYGEAIGPLRRAKALSEEPKEILVELSKALLRRGRGLAAFASMREAERVGANGPALEGIKEDLNKRFGNVLRDLRELLN